MSQTDINVMSAKIKELSSAKKQDHGMLDDYRMNRDIWRNRKLSRHFVKTLLQKLDIPQSHIDKCLKVPLAVYSKVLVLIHNIVNGKAGYGKLAELRKLMCDDLKIIPKRMKDALVFKDVRNFMNKHIEFNPDKK